MKQTKLTLFLLAFVIMQTMLSAVTPHSKSNLSPAVKQTSYYWFDVTNTWLGRQNTLAAEESLTGYNENTGTLQEKGWSVANCTVDGQGLPHPNTGSADKLLYSHP